MRIQQLSASLALAVMAAGAQAATVLTQNFDSVPALTGLGWVQVNNSAAPVGTPWDQGNTGIFNAASGANDSFIGANFLSTAAATGAVSNWLILPSLTLDSSSTISFAVRAAGDGFLDTIEVRFNATGSTDVGSTTSSVGGFTALLGTYSSSTDAGWVNQSYSVGLGASTTGRLAIRYVVANVATAGNYIGIDNVVVTAVPEPATYGLMALGVAGLLLRRRQLSA